MLADDTPLFVDGDGGGEIDPVTVPECELDTEVIVRAAFAEEKAAEPATEPDQEPVEQPEEEPAQEPVEEPDEEPAQEPVEEPEEKPAEEPITDGAPVANALVYTGEVQALVSGGEGWLFSTDCDTYSEDIPTAVDAGEYTVFYKTAEEAEAQSMVVTVAKADAVVIAPPVATVPED
jgi:hypothetical protein